MGSAVKEFFLIGKVAKRKLKTEPKMLVRAVSFLWSRSRQKVLNGDAIPGANFRLDLQGLFNDVAGET